MGTVTVLLGAIVASACGDSSTTTGTAQAIDAYPSRYAHAACDELGPCCAANGVASYNRGNCELGAFAFVQQGVDAAKAAGASFDVQAADACVAAVTALTKRCASGEDDRTATTACTRVFSGPKRPGEPCAQDLDCAATTEGRGSCYKANAGDATGTCVSRKSPAAVGDVCLVTSGAPPAVLADCDRSDLRCDLSGTCMARIAVGGACNALRPCVSGATCDGSGTCIPALAAGATCESDDACASRACVQGKCGANSAGRELQCVGQKK